MWRFESSQGCWTSRCRFDSCQGRASAISSAAEQPVHTGQAGGSSPSSRTEDEAEGSKHRAVTPVEAGFESRHPPQPAPVAERSIAPGCRPGSSDTVVRIHPGARTLPWSSG
jgi:hypothetical protein